ncbi:TerD family protein [Aeromicrobium sp.]|uniref:TerD family protein n=1 Tax=Aeromicrobium sp. TaxID=1871063 RepID=UPI00199BD9C6|nr:TerD family protein [Aeromicrobium sp.]MBC7631654.1 TerD family protein [Aeromicrobium sp.]
MADPEVVRLRSGANVALSTLMPAPGGVVVGFSWQVVEARGPAVQLVPSAIVCGPNGKAVSSEHLVFFNQLASPDGTVQIISDTADEEQIEVDLREVPASVDKIVLMVYVDPDLRRPGTFAAVRHAFFRVYDRSGREMVRYDIEEYSAEVNAMIFGELYRHRGEWKVRAIGQGYSTGLMGVGETFGVSL